MTVGTNINKEIHSTDKAISQVTLQLSNAYHSTLIVHSRRISPGSGYCEALLLNTLAYLAGHLLRTLVASIVAYPSGTRVHQNVRLMLANHTYQSKPTTVGFVTIKEVRIYRPLIVRLNIFVRFPEIGSITVAALLCQPSAVPENHVYLAIFCHKRTRVAIQFFLHESCVLLMPRSSSITELVGFAICSCHVVIPRIAPVDKRLVQSYTHTAVATCVNILAHEVAVESLA